MRLDPRFYMSRSNQPEKPEKAIDKSQIKTMVLSDDAELPAQVANVSREDLRRYAQCKRVGNYLLGRTVGEGSFAKVKEAIHTLTGEKVRYLLMQYTCILTCLQGEIVPYWSGRMRYISALSHSGLSSCTGTIYDMETNKPSVIWCIHNTHCIVWSLSLNEIVCLSVMYFNNSRILLRYFKCAKRDWKLFHLSLGIRRFGFVLALRWLSMNLSGFH